jgi:hypothetical protein
MILPLSLRSRCRLACPESRNSPTSLARTREPVRFAAKLAGALVDHFTHAAEPGHRDLFDIDDSFHAAGTGASVRYRHAMPEELVAEGCTFDSVLSLEVVEHVASVPMFLAALAGRLGTEFHGIWL